MKILGTLMVMIALTLGSTSCKKQNTRATASIADDQMMLEHRAQSQTWEHKAKSPVWMHKAQPSLR